MHTNTARLDTHGWLLFGGLALVLCALIVTPAGAGPQTSPPSPPQPGTGPQNQTQAAALLRPPMPAIATSDSNEAMIAVTGVDITGASILYLIDTQNRQLAVYQANGGSESTQSVKLIGARRIDLDLKLYGYNDKSEHSFEELQKRFAALKSGGPNDK